MTGDHAARAQAGSQVDQAAATLAPLLEAGQDASLHGLCVDDRCIDVDAGLDNTPLSLLYPGAI